jgi:hypothetical protein
MVAISHPNSIRTPRPRPVPVAVSAATYRRRRLVAAALALLVLLALANVALQLTSGSARSGAATRPVVELSVVVEPGDTVWSIAESLARGGDVRPVVDALVDANGGADLEVGDRLVIALP